LPTIDFRSNEITSTGKGTSTVKGDLTIRSSPRLVVIRPPTSEWRRIGGARRRRLSAAPRCTSQDIVGSAAGSSSTKVSVVCRLAVVR
jgi:hypothetical protein